MSRDPYRPPRAGIDDVAAAAPPSKRMRWKRIAVAIVGIWLAVQLVAFVLGASGDMLLSSQYRIAPADHAQALQLVTGIAAFVGFLVFLRGVPARRLLHAVVVFLGIEALEVSLSAVFFGLRLPAAIDVARHAVAPALALAWCALSARGRK